MVRAFQRAVLRDVVGACRPPAERRGGGRAARAPQRARHERLCLRLANGIRTTLEDGALCARGTGGVKTKAERPIFSLIYEVGSAPIEVRDKIIKGANPAELPTGPPTRTSLHGLPRAFPLTQTGHGVTIAAWRADELGGFNLAAAVGRQSPANQL